MNEILFRIYDYIGLETLLDKGKDIINSILNERSSADSLSGKGAY